MNLLCVFSSKKMSLSSYSVGDKICFLNLIFNGYCKFCAFCLVLFRILGSLTLIFLEIKAVKTNCVDLLTSYLGQRDILSHSGRIFNFAELAP